MAIKYDIKPKKLVFPRGKYEAQRVRVDITLEDDTGNTSPINKFSSKLTVAKNKSCMEKSNPYVGYQYYERGKSVTAEEDKILTEDRPSYLNVGETQVHYFDVAPNKEAQKRGAKCKAYIKIQADDESITDDQQSCEITVIGRVRRGPIIIASAIAILILLWIFQLTCTFGNLGEFCYPRRIGDITGLADVPFDFSYLKNPFPHDIFTSFFSNTN